MFLRVLVPIDSGCPRQRCKPMIMPSNIFVILTEAMAGVVRSYNVVSCSLIAGTNKRPQSIAYKFALKDN